jgi:ATP-dependent Clp protease ATP-binding subunit ClpB
MNLNNFTIKSQEALQEAQEIAAAHEHQAIEPSHLLKGMLEVDENVIPFILKKANVNPDEIISETDTIINTYPKVTDAKQYLSDESNKVIQKSMAFMRSFEDEFVSIEHIFMGMLLGKDRTAQMLKQHGLNERDVKAAITEIRKGAKVNSPSAEESYNALSRYAKNLNELARQG